MAQLDGKQLKNSTTSVDKLSGTGIVTFTAATVSFGAGAKITTLDANILTGIDVVNKNYVDGIAAGLDPKQPVQAIAVGPITLSGVGAVIDGWTVSAGDRILVNGQAGPITATSTNGIYSATAGAWSRTLDADGTPASEISTGNFVFVHEGITYEHSGWVLNITNASNPAAILAGTDSQLWIQFSEQTNILAGDGLSFTGQNLNVNVGSGITISSDAVAVDYATVAKVMGGAGLTGFGNVLNVGAGNGITVAADSVAVGLTAVSGLTFSGGALMASVDGTSVAINAQGQLYSISTGDITGVTAGAGLTGGGASGYVTLDVQTTNGVSIIGDSVGLGGTLTQNTTIAGAAYDLTLGNIDYLMITASVFDVVSELVIINAGTGSADIYGDAGVTLVSAGGNIDLLSTGGNVNISGTAGNVTTTGLLGLVYTADYSATFITQSLVTKGYVDSLVTGGDITGVTAGAGLTGGGSSGYVTLNVGAGNGISVAVDSVAVGLTAVSGLTFSGAALMASVDGTTVGINAQGQLFSVSTGDITGVTAGAGLTGGGASGYVTLDIGAGFGITVNADDIAVNFNTVSSVLGGAGLTGIGILNVGAGNGISVAADSVAVGLTAVSGLTFSGGALMTSVDGSTININTGGQLTVVGFTATGTPVYTQRNLTPSVTSGNGSTTGITLTNTPSDGINLSVYVNGQMQFVGNGVTASVDCYFGATPALSVSMVNLVSGNTLYWNGVFAGYELSATDKVDIIYNS